MIDSYTVSIIDSFDKGTLFYDLGRTQDEAPFHRARPVELPRMTLSISPNTSANDFHSRHVIHKHILSARRPV